MSCVKSVLRHTTKSHNVLDVLNLAATFNSLLFFAIDMEQTVHVVVNTEENLLEYDG